DTLRENRNPPRLPSGEVLRASARSRHSGLRPRRRTSGIRHPAEEGRRQKAKGRRQKPQGRRQKPQGRRHMITPQPKTLEGRGIRLEPLSLDHHDGLKAAVLDGQLWDLWFTSAPEPGEVGVYIERAREGQRAGLMLPWAV